MKSFLSRKFLATLGAAIATGILAHPSIAPYLIIGVVAVYVICETVLDRLGMPAGGSLKDVLASLTSAITANNAAISGAISSLPAPVVNVTAMTTPPAPSNPPVPSTLPASAVPPTTPAASPPTSAKAAPAMIAGVVLAMTGLFLILACACSSPKSPSGAGGDAAADAKNPCSDLALADIESQYISEVVSACKGQKFEACTARPALEEKYAARREEWSKCH